MIVFIIQRLLLDLFTNQIFFFNSKDTLKNLLLNTSTTPASSGYCKQKWVVVIGPPFWYDFAGIAYLRAV